MISVEEALARLLAPLEALPPEQVSIAEGIGRVLAEDLAARRTQPPFAVSAMDGYAVRADDLGRIPVSLRIVAEIPAGAGFGGTLGPGEAARIFTGAPLPDGADTIIIQEDTERSGDRVEIREGAARGRYVRRAGLDFAEGEVLLHAGRRLSPRDIGLAAAMNRPWLFVHRRPRVGVLSTGDEIVMPGDPIGPHPADISTYLCLRGSAGQQAEPSKSENSGEDQCQQHHGKREVEAIGQDDNRTDLPTGRWENGSDTHRTCPDLDGEYRLDNDKHAERSNGSRQRRSIPQWAEHDQVEKGAEQRSDRQSDDRRWKEAQRCSEVHLRW